MKLKIKWLGLQIFGDGGGDGGAAGATGGDGATTTAENAPVAEETRLRELGVPESVLAKRSKRANKGNNTNASVVPVTPAQQSDDNSNNIASPEGNQADDTPKRMTWDEIMADPEYNKEMQKTMQARLRSSKGAEESLSKLQPAIELLARKYGLDSDNLDIDALTNAISDDDSYYEDKALEMGVPIETAKKIDQNERQTAREQAEQARTIEQQRIQNHLAKLEQQGNELKKTFKNFDLATELQNPAFFRMTSPNVGISVEDAYYAVHRNEIQQAAMQVTARKTAEQMANSIRAGQSRPVENGTSAQAPSNSTFDYAHASKEQREALKKQIREAAAQGKKLYPGQF